MTQATHTPGPWTHKATAGDHEFLIYPEDGGRDVALVRDFHEPNALLIAAAPDLLEIVKDLHDDWPEFDEPSDSETSDVNGCDLVDYIGGLRLRLKVVLEKAGAL